MKKTLLASAIAVSALGSVTAQADIAVTSMAFGASYAATGTLTDAGDGTMTSIDPFYSNHWTATQQTVIMDNSGSWSGTSQGLGTLGTTYNFDADISAMSAGQRAVGLYFAWNSSTEIAVLEIFNCDNDGAGDTCSGVGVPMANGPFTGSIATFSGAEVPEVPVPAAVWLMGSGLLGLVGVARRRKA